MATALPALAGRFGSYDYWVTTMHVGELNSNIVIPKDDPDWPGLSIEERYQRDVNLARVKRDIAPYFAQNPDRFSGALIVAVKNSDRMVFEPLTDLVSKMPSLYRTAAENMGILTLDGSEVLVPLDGQHRAMAFRYALSGVDESNKEVTRPNSKLAEDEVTVILVKFDTTSSRRIFTTVNRHAKPTGKGDNIITDDDDAVAVATRMLIGGDDDGRGGGYVLPARLVRFQSNTLSAKAPEFTTLATFYDANMAIIQALVWSGVKGKPEGANEQQRERFREKCEDVWNRLLTSIELFAQAVEDGSEQGDAARIRIREQTLLGKPIGQMVLVRAFLEIRDRIGKSDTEVCKRLNLIDWSVEWSEWENVMMNASRRVMSGKTTVNNAALFVARLCGAKLEEHEERDLQTWIAGDSSDYSLPDPLA